MIFVLGIMLSRSFVYGQFKNFGSKAKHKPEPNYFYSVYGYFDLIRESGVGFQYQLGIKWNLDASTYLINKQGSLSGTISQWDYYDLTGYGFSFKPKYLLSRMNRFYIGANLAIEALHHDKTWVEYTLGRGDRLYKLEESRGIAYTLGFTLGNRMTYKRLLIEPFFGMGYVISDLSSKSFASTTGGTVEYFSQPVAVSNHDYFQLNIGIKFGCSFKKNKTNEGIDKKFDNIYILKQDSLTKKFQSINYKRPYLSEAYSNYKYLNRHALLRYRRCYSDTTKLYKNINLLFHEIDDLIFLHNEIKIAVDSAYGKRKEAYETYFKTVNVSDENTPSNIKKAYRRYTRLDRLILRHYSLYKKNKTDFYKVIDHHFYNIDKLINPESK